MELFVDKLIQLNARTDSRDKIARLLQYGCRALWDHLNKGIESADIIDKLKTLEFLLSSFRKLLRFGRCIDFLHAAQKTVHLRNVTLRFTLTTSKLAQALYLYADHIIWLSRSGITKSIDAKKWNDRANKYWLLSIVMNLCRDFYELSKLINQSMVDGHSIKKTLCNLYTQEHFVQTIQQFYTHAYYNRAILIDTTKNICDFFIPLTALGYTNLKPRTVGILGVISSLAAIIVLLQPAAKLTP